MYQIETHRFVKVVIHVIIALGISVTSLKSYAEGPGSGNGGDLEPSTEKQIIDMISNEFPTQFGFYMGLVLEVGVTTQMFNPEATNDPDLKKVFEMTGASFRETGYGVISKNKLSVELMKSKFVVHKECFDKEGKSKDASTEPKSGAEICFSSEKLKRIPYGSLKEYMIILGYHELAHHIIGDWELGAQKLQNYIEKYKNTLVLQGWNDYPLNPGGFIKFNVDSKTVTVRCLGPAQFDPDKILEPAPFTTNLDLGSRIQMFTDEKGPNVHVYAPGYNTISCRDSLPVSCSLKPDGLQFGNLFDAETPERSAELLRIYQDANICKK